MTPNEKIVVIGASLASFAIGSTVSYFVTKKIFKTRYDALINKELTEVKLYYSNKLRGDEEKLQKHYRRKVRDLEYGTEDPDPDPDPEPITTESYLDEPDRPDFEGTFDYADELPNRTADHPYVIHVEEFMANEEDYDQVSITYYEGDDVLADEKDSPIPDPDSIVGLHNLERFGHGSKDNRVVYVRNEKIQMEFEIIHRDGDYSKEVLGFIEHSERRGRPRKFRSEDE